VEISFDYMISKAEFIENRLESYVEAMYNASTIFVDESPDFILSPMNGSVPFVDAMAIVNSDFDPSKVVYMPASSRIKDVSNIITDWYSNFLEKNVHSSFELPKVIGIDEVVSGNSVVRCIHGIDRAVKRKRRKEVQSLVDRLTSMSDSTKDTIDEIDQISEHEHALRFSEVKNKLSLGFYKLNREKATEDLSFCIDVVKDYFSDKLIYRTIGIEDSKKEERNKEYNGLKEDNRVISVGVKKIISMDLPDFYPPVLKELPNTNGHHYLKFSPLVDRFLVTERYLDFLRSIAMVVGKNPDEVNPINMVPIIESKKYLSEKYHNDYQ